MRLTPYVHTLDEYIGVTYELLHIMFVSCCQSHALTDNFLLGLVRGGLGQWASVMSMYLVPCT